MLEVTILAILQGVAEFLPISSSGHLVIAQHLLGVNEAGMRLDVFLHLGTLASILFFYARPIARILVDRQWIYMGKILLSTLPALLVYFVFGDFIAALFENARMVGALLMFTGAMLLGTRYIPCGSRDVSILRALFMGIGQAVALLPGVSRSGMTLVFARGGKVEPEKAAEFSFLMSAPLIVGAAGMELIKCLKCDSAVSSAAETSWSLTIYGTIVAAIVGYWSLKLLLKSLKGRWFWLFGPYCIVAGLLALIFC
jgi:undecaprenyl-diphosphatase